MFSRLSRRGGGAEWLHPDAKNCWRTTIEKLLGFRITAIFGCLWCSARLELGSLASNIIIFYTAACLFAVDRDRLFTFPLHG